MPDEWIDLWVVDLDRWDRTAPGPEWLTGEDRARAARLRDPVVARRLLARRSLTRWLLADALGIGAGELVVDRRCPTCGRSDHGRPVVRDAPIEFSVSSSHQVATVAVSGRSVGVDVELLRSGIRPLPDALSDRERRELLALGDSRAQAEGFLRLWTAKEAVLKAGGQDLSDDPSRVDVADLLSAGSATVASAGRTWVVRHPASSPAVGVPTVVAVADGHGAAVVTRSVDDRPPRDAS